MPGRRSYGLGTPWEAAATASTFSGHQEIRRTPIVGPQRGPRRRVRRSGATGKPVPWIMRMCAFVPANVPIMFGVIMTK